MFINNINNAFIYLIIIDMIQSLEINQTDITSKRWPPNSSVCYFFNTGIKL